MRVIAGDAKGRRLRAPTGAGTRPLTDRVKEAIFSSLGEEVVGARVLDLFAGSGAFGLEALSRGASVVLFVEKSRQALTALRANISKVGLGGEVAACTVTEYLASTDERFDLVFVDAPWDLAVGEVLASSVARMVAGGTLILSRRRQDENPPTPSGLIVSAQKRYGDARITWYDKETD